MDLTNGKRLSTEVLNERRRQAVRLRLSGMKLAAVSAGIGLSPGTIISAMKSYKGGGLAGSGDRGTWPLGGRGPDPDGRTGEDLAQDDQRQDPRPTQDALCAVDPIGGWRSGSSAVRRQVAGAHRGTLSEALGIYAAEADPQGLRATACGGEEVAGQRLSEDRAASQGGRGGDPLGR